MGPLRQPAKDPDHASLLQISGDRQVWSENMDVKLNDVFKVQTEIAIQVIYALGIVLKGNEKQYQ